MKQNEKSTKNGNKNVKKNLLIVGDSIIRDIEGWRMKKRMKSFVSVKSISGASSKAMVHHVRGCLTDLTPDRVILHCGTNSLKEEKNLEIIADDIINLAVSIKSEVEEVYVSELTIRNDNLNEKRKKVNEMLRTKCKEKDLLNIQHDNITLNMLNSKGLHLNEYGSTRLANNFCFNVSN